MSSPADLSSKWLKVSEPWPHVLHIELSREPVNAFSAEFWRTYSALFNRIISEGWDVRAAVLSSSLPKLFTAGIDFTDAAKITTGGLTGVPQPDAARDSLSLHRDILEFQNAIRAPERAPFPVIAATHGLVLGLGVDIIAACDVRYAASSSQFAVKEVDIGLAADVGSLAYLPKIAGNSSLVRELAFTGRTFSVQEAEHAGLISRVVEGGRGEVVEAALELARVIASKSPVAVSGTKRILVHSRDHSVPQNLEYTAAWNAGALRTQDILESIAATRERRAPQFSALRAAKTKL